MGKKILTDIALGVVITVTFFKIGQYIAFQVNRSGDVKAAPLVVMNKENYAIPDRLVIPKLSLNTYIEKVGLDSKGNMDVPSNVNDTAWYEYGPYPGDTGSAVIAGHLDTPTGPSVFWGLSTLKPGDEITVYETNGKVLTFIVNDTSMVSNADFPVNKVFSSGDGKAELNLITCGGVWDTAKHEYLSRTVVYSTLSSVSQ